MLFISSTFLAALCTTYTIVYYTNRSKIFKYVPKSDEPQTNVYQQDNIPWYVKIIWGLYVVTSSLAVLISVGYWILVYNPCSSESTQNGSSGSEEINRTEVSTGSGSEESCFDLDVYTLQIHLVNILIVLLDLFISRIPFQLFHFINTTSFTLPYALFTIIYWGAGGTDSDGNRYIYVALNYDESRLSILFVFGLIPAGFIIFLIIFLLAWLRDAVYSHVRVCFREDRILPYQGEIESQGKEENKKK